VNQDRKSSESDSHALIEQSERGGCFDPAISFPLVYSLRAGRTKAYNADISTDCLALRGVSPFLSVLFLKVKTALGCSS